MSITNYFKYLKLKATAILSPGFVVRVSGSDDRQVFFSLNLLKSLSGTQLVHRLIQGNFTYTFDALAAKFIEQGSAGCHTDICMWLLHC